MEEITVKEYAQLRGCTERYVIKLISEGKLSANEKWGQGGNKGLSYMIPLSSIDDPKLIAKYRRIKSRKANNGRTKETKPVTLPDKEAMTEKERGEITFWKQVIAGWDEYRPPGKSREEATEEYVHYLQEKYPDKRKQFSAGILYRKSRNLKQMGEASLVDKRGKHDGHKRAVPKEVFDIFEYYYLDQSKKSVQKCKYERIVEPAGCKRA